MDSTKHKQATIGITLNDKNKTNWALKLGLTLIAHWYSSPTKRLRKNLMSSCSTGFCSLFFKCSTNAMNDGIARKAENVTRCL